MQTHRCNTLVIGAGIVGIATAYYLKKHQPDLKVILIDAGQPMALTSAQSGENYRNWWPHPVMTAFTDHSIDLMEAIAWESGDRINMTRRGYVLATRSDDPTQLLEELRTGYGTDAERLIRVHEHAGQNTYQPARSSDWQSAPSGGSDLCDKEASRAARQSVRHAADDNHGVLGRGCRAHERGGTASAREWQNGIKAEERLVVSRVFGCTGFLGPHSSRNSA